MSKNNYSLKNKITFFDEYINTYIGTSIPSVHRELKIKLYDEKYNLIKNMLYATYNKGNIRIKYITEIQVTISMIDILLNEIRKLKCIKEKYIMSSIEQLSEIKTIVYGWKINEEDYKK